jgi:hypothetical protein
MAAAPKLRGDLVIRPQASGRGTSVVVKDPAARRFFRFGEVEHFVAQQLDGATSLDVIRARVEERFGQPLPEQTLQHFVEQFRRFRLLDDGTERREDEHAHQRVRGSLLYIRVKAFDPDRLLDSLVTRLNVVFTRTFLMASAATILVAPAVAAVGWASSPDLMRLYRFDALLVAWVTVLSVITVLSSRTESRKRFGGQVNEIGFMLLIFSRRFTATSVTPGSFGKIETTWVTFAGAYSKCWCGRSRPLRGELPKPMTWINFVALVIMATSE